MKRLMLLPIFGLFAGCVGMDPVYYPEYTACAVAPVSSCGVPTAAPVYQTAAPPLIAGSSPVITNREPPH